jgi:hypothetical protein
LAFDFSQGVASESRTVPKLTNLSGGSGSPWL